MRRPLSPLGLLREGFDWTGRTRRLGFILFTLVMLALLLTHVFVVEPAVWPRWGKALIIASFAVLWLPYNGHIHRRLNDLGWSPWVWWLLLIPGIGFLLILSLCLRTGERYSPTGVIGRLLAIPVTLLMTSVLFLRLLWAPFGIVTPDMKPTLLVGDMALISLGHYVPNRGDIVAFRQRVSGQTGVLRVIGLPGDDLQIRDGVLHINQVPVSVENFGDFTEILQRQGPQSVLPRCENGAVAIGAPCRKSLHAETLPNGHRNFVLNIGTQRSDDTGVFSVPIGHYFVMGDNRDNTGDSRTSSNARGVGFINSDDISGRVDYVAFSSSGSYLLAFWSWRPDRIIEAVE